MAIPHANPGEVIRLLETEGPATDKSTTLIKTPRLEVIRLVLPAGKKIPPHSVSREVTVQCLSGQVIFESRGGQQTIEPGTLLYLEGGDTHALEAVVESIVLVTIVLAG